MRKPKVIALIPARGGSRGIPYKNIRSLVGKPLIAWTIEAALASKCIDKVVVSTEDNEIAKVSQKYGAEIPFLRPKELSQDHSLRNEVVTHALNELPGYDFVILLQPTSPLRSGEDIDAAFEFFINSKGMSCVSVVSQHPTPEWMFKLDSSKNLIPLNPSTKITNRQSTPDYYSLNGAIYITNCEYFLSSKEADPFIGKEAVGYIMPKWSSLDIDDEEDWEIAEFKLISKKNKKNR